MAASQKDGSGGGCFGWLIGGAIVLAIIVYSVSGLGNLLGLTPTGDEVLDSEDGFVSANYQGVVFGYILTVLVIALPIAAYFVYGWSKANQTAEEHAQTMGGVIGLAVLLLALIVVLPVGARETPLDQGGDGSGQGVAAAREDRQDAQQAREKARLERARERRAQERREQQRIAAAKRKEQAEQEPQAVAAPAPSCDPNYEGACLDPNASDYDCAGGEGDGPEYTGPVTVVGTDHYDLDTGDGDPRACELE